ncbi:MAG: S8 family serine peptidase [Desulfobacterales bacterium]
MVSGGREKGLWLVLLFLCFALFLFAGTGWGKYFPEKQTEKKVQLKRQDRENNPGFQPFKRFEKNKGVLDKAEYVKGEVLVKFREGIDLYEAEHAGHSRQMSVASHYKALSQEKKASYMLFKSDKSTSEMIRELKDDPAVEAVSPNYIRRIMAEPNDPLYDELWGYQKIQAEDAWDTNTGSPDIDGEDVIVAIIDSGVDYTHQDLKDNMWTNPDPEEGVDDIHGINAVADTGDPMDNHGHGTHVAGTTGAVGNNGKLITGVNWDVKIMALKALSAFGTGEDADILKCLNYIIEQKEAGQNIVAVNASYGGSGYSEVVKDSIAQLGELGIVFCAAAGNSGNDNDLIPSYPGSYDLDNIISVAATNPDDELAGFSNYGPSSVDLAAPGTNILSTVPGGGYEPEPSDVFFDDMESDDDNWSHGGENDFWEITEDESLSEYKAWGYSPDIDSSNGTNAWLQADQRSDLSDYQEDKVALGGWLKYEIKDNEDFLYLEVSNDNGDTWTPAGSITGTSDDDWKPGFFYLPERFKTDKFMFRFRLNTDDIETIDGVYIDDVGIGIGEGSTATVAYQGTSMAAPHVTGAVALMAAQHPNEDMLTRKNRILSGVDRADLLEGKLSKDARLNLASSINSELDFEPLITGSVTYGVSPGNPFTLNGVSFGEQGQILFTNGDDTWTAQTETWTESSTTESSIEATAPEDKNTGNYIRISDAQGKTSNLVKATAWKEMTNTQSGLIAGAAVAYDEKFWHFGGAGYEYSSATDTIVYYPTDTISYYDPGSDPVTDIDPMPGDRWFHDAAVYDDSIYVLGGSDENGEIQANFWRYDPVEDFWQSMEDNLPVSLAALQAVSLDGTLYAIGGDSSDSIGGDSSDYTDAFYAYNGDGWKKKESMKRARAYHGAVAVNGKIYVFGGSNSEGILSSCEVYDPQTKNWSDLPDIPIALDNFDITTDGDYIYIIGGNAGSYISPYILCFDPESGSWTYQADTLFDLPRGRASASAAFLPEYGHILFGGTDGSTIYNKIHNLETYPLPRDTSSDGGSGGGGGGGGCFINLLCN